MFGITSNQRKKILLLIVPFMLANAIRVNQDYFKKEQLLVFTLSSRRMRH